MIIEEFAIKMEREPLSMKKEKIGSVELHDYLMGDYRRVCYSTGRWIIIDKERTDWQC